MVAKERVLSRAACNDRKFAQVGTQIPASLIDRIRMKTQTRHYFRLERCSMACTGTMVSRRVYLELVLVGGWGTR
jgi:hypothetical protein